jgi:tetratricopeptide (TPR) repeat protein
MLLPRAFLLILLGVASAPAATAAAMPHCGPERMVQIIERLRASAFARCLDARALAARALEPLEVGDKDRTDLAEGLAGAKRKMASDFMKMLDGKIASVRLAADRLDGRQDRFLVRLDLIGTDGEPAGYNYLVFARTAEGRIADWYSHVQGAWASDVMRQVAVHSLGDRGPLARLLGNVQFDRATLRRFTTFFEQLREGRYAKAFETFEQLPAEFRTSKAGAALRVQVAANLGEAQHRDALDQLARWHGDAPEFQFLLIDHHFYREDYDRALGSIAAFESAVVEDGATNFLRCSVLLMAERHAEARAACERSITLEPGAEQTWWSLATIGIKSRDPVLTLDTLASLETHFDYAFDPDALVEHETYAWLADHPEFKEWAAARR